MLELQSTIDALDTQSCMLLSQTRSVAVVCHWSLSLTSFCAMDVVHHRKSVVLGLSVSNDADLPDDERERETTPVTGSERSELASAMDRCHSVSAECPEF